jgi:plastocyanin
MIKFRFHVAVFALILLIAAVPLFAQQGGTIVGHVKLTAPPARPNPPIPMGADPNCLSINAGKRVLQETVLRAADGGLANAFVNVKGSFPATPVPAASAVIDQRGCTYHPRIQGVRVGQTLQVKNSDQTLHNIHSLSTKNNTFNTGQPMAGMVFKYQLKAEEVMLHVKCDVHPWMTGYLGVVSHPYYAVSDATGAFQIAGVPPGKQTIQVWHERYGLLTQVVDVKAGATTNVDFAYTGSEKPVPAADLRMEELTVPDGATAIELLAPSEAR